MRFRFWAFCILVFWAFQAKAADFTFSISADHSALLDPISANAIADFGELLDSACHCKVKDDALAEVTFEILPLQPGADTIQSRFEAERDYPYFHTPNSAFKWNGDRNLIGKYVMKLNSPTSRGVAAGLYALLQEVLGFKFLHPRQTIIPKLEHWPISLPGFDFAGNPNFDKRGFHLHTMHPLELTQPLHDPDFPNGKEMIREYLRWLARNGQNYFDFCLMEGVDDFLEKWANHAAEFTQYARDRGILCGIDLSLHMVQQKSFKLVEFKPKDFRSAEKQIRMRLKTLMRANWDFINLEFSLAEFVGGMENLRDKMREVVIDELKKYPNTKLVGRQHVVKPEDEIGGKHDEASLNVPQSNEMGLLVHTVMCYALRDSSAPVYELKNFSHLYDMLIAEDKVRETWYYPESAYWVTFDNSIPLFLMPYLGARWRDIETLKTLKIPGHVTFSSGWEWGYWVVDWSIARWSWSYSYKGQTLKKEPLKYLKEIWNSSDFDALQQIADLQQEKFIQKDFLRFLCPTNPTDELPKKFSKQFQPRMDYKWGEMGRRNFLKKHPNFEAPIDELLETSIQHLKIAEQLSNSQPSENMLTNLLRQEIIDALRVTGLRCLHQAQLLRAVKDGKEYYEAAKATRLFALDFVHQQEGRYRYPLWLLTSQYGSFTSYDFGYLHTVHDLHFWKREEGQFKRKKKSLFYKNKYDLPKIAGFKD